MDTICTRVENYFHVSKTFNFDTEILMVSLQDIESMCVVGVCVCVCVCVCGAVCGGVGIIIIMGLCV